MSDRVYIIEEDFQDSTSLQREIEKDKNIKAIIVKENEIEKTFNRLRELNPQHYSFIFIGSEKNRIDDIQVDYIVGNDSSQIINNIKEILYGLYI